MARPRPLIDLRRAIRTGTVPGSALPSALERQPGLCVIISFHGKTLSSAGV